MSFRCTLKPFSMLFTILNLYFELVLGWQHFLITIKSYTVHLKLFLLCEFYYKGTYRTGEWKGRGQSSHNRPPLSPTPSLLIHSDIASSSREWLPSASCCFNKPSAVIGQHNHYYCAGYLSCSVCPIRWLSALDFVRKLLNFNKFKYSICYFKQQAAFHISHHVRNALLEDSRCCLLSWVHGLWPFLAQ